MHDVYISYVLHNIIFQYTAITDTIVISVCNDIKMYYAHSIMRLQAVEKNNCS